MKPLFSHRVPRPFSVGQATMFGFVIACALACAAAFVGVGSGCSTTRQGLAREQAMYQAGTNAVAYTQRVGAMLPPPASSAVELGGALAAIALGAWNTWQHKAIRKLQNGQGLAAAARVATDAYSAGHEAGMKAQKLIVPVKDLAQPPPG